MAEMSAGRLQEKTAIIYEAASRSAQAKQTPKQGSGMKSIMAVRAVAWLTVGLGVNFFVSAATIRVPQDQSTITAGVAAAKDGDTVAVSPGTYNEINIQITKNLTVTSLSGSTNTIIDSQHNGRGFIVTGGTLTDVNIIGFTIQNGQLPYRDGGGAVLVASGKCRISGCIIQGVSGPADYSGGPIGNHGANVDDVIVDNCIIRNNFAANGCGIGACAARNCLIYNNSAGNNPMALSGCHATNCTVYNNTGGYLPNPWTVGGMSGGTAVNCIFWGNSGHNGQQIDPTSPETVTYSIVQGGWTGTGNLSSDPLFVDAPNGDFHLKANSPAINSGDPSILKPDGTRSDIGYTYESQAAPSDFVWTKLPGNTPSGWSSFPSSFDVNRGIVYSLSSSGDLWSYNIQNNAFTHLPVSGTWPGRVDQCIYNPDENTIWFTPYGRGQVFRLPVTGGAVTSVGASGASSSDFYNTTFWNPITHKYGTVFGYGFGADRNWRWELGTTDSDWVQIESNAPGRELRTSNARTAAIDFSSQRLFVFGGQGNSTGSQGYFDPGFLPDGNFDALRDLWVLNFKSSSWNKLIPLNTSIPIGGRITYYPPLDMLLLINGTSTDHTQITGLWTFTFAQGTNWTPVVATGDVPLASDELVLQDASAGIIATAYYDSSRNRIIYFNNKGVYALSFGPPPPALVVTWANPADISYGTPLSHDQLNATVNVPGTFTYSPPAGTVLNAGTAQTLSVTFTPTETTNYKPVTKAVSINVLQATPQLSWTNPTDITYGTPLSPNQLNATANVPGIFIYSPPAGTVLQAGAGQTLSVTFTPTDSTDYKSATAIVSLTVNTPVTITQQPQSQTVNPGGNVTFSVTAAGTTPLTYQWKFNGSAISGATSASLTLNGVSSANAGSYTAEVGNVVGTVTSAAALLVVNTAVSIVQQPGDVNAVAGSDLALQVTAAGTAPLTYLWKLNGTPIADATSAILLLKGVTSANAGNYTVDVSNLLGTVRSDPALLTVFVPPTITLQPQSQQLLAGSDATFAVSASGSTPLSYQWSKNGVALSGLNSPNCVIRAVTTSDAGTYTVSVSNLYGTATSVPAILTVVVPNIVIHDQTSGGGIAMRDPFQSSFPPNSVVTLTAKPNDGWTFLDWRDNAQGTNPVVQITMTYPKSVRARFGTPITLLPSANGTVTVDPESPLYPYDTPVRIVAKPQDGSYFAGWSGSATGDVNPLPMLVRDANAIVSASFLPLPAGKVALTVVPDGNGKVSVGPRANLFSIGQTVTNTALPDPGQEFLGWTGDAQGLGNPLVLAMDRSKNVTARFTRRPHLDLQMSGKDGALLTLTGEFTGAYHVLRSSDLVGWSEILTLTNAYDEAQMMDPPSDRGFYFKAIEVAPIQRTATAVPTVVNGFVVAVTVTDGGDGYTTAPQVTITGGGGTGAAATAIVLEGKVDKVIVVNAGNGYTETPTVLIAPPGP